MNIRYFTFPGCAEKVCMTLLFAGQGRPIEKLGDDEFLAITGALILPRLQAIAALTAARDEAGLARELADLKSIY